MCGVRCVDVIAATSHEVLSCTANTNSSYSHGSHPTIEIDGLVNTSYSSSPLAVPWFCFLVDQGANAQRVDQASQYAIAASEGTTTATYLP